MQNVTLEPSRAQVLRRVAAALVIAALPLLNAASQSAALQYNAIWNATINHYWGGVALDASMALLCIISPFHVALCGALAVV